MSAALVAGGQRLRDPIAVGVLAVVAVGAERGSIELDPELEVSISSLVYVFAAVVFGPLAGVAVAAAGLLIDLPRRDVAQTRAPVDDLDCEPNDRRRWFGHGGSCGARPIRARLPRLFCRRVSSACS